MTTTATTATTTTTTTTAARRKPTFHIYRHGPVGMATGTALSIVLHPATDGHDGGLFLRMARQVSAWDGGDDSSSARYDWKDALAIKLGFGSLCRVLAVLRGRQDEAMAMSCIQQTTTCFSVRRNRDGGCDLAIERGPIGRKETVRLELWRNESDGLAAAIEGSMAVIAFGVPTAMGEAAYAKGGAA